MLNKRDAIEIVQKAIVMAGGYNEEHQENETLNQAGLKSGHQRESFQRKVAVGVGEKGHKIGEVSKIPNHAQTTVAGVREYIVKTAVPIPREQEGK